MDYVQKLETGSVIALVVGGALLVNSWINSSAVQSAIDTVVEGAENFGEAISTLSCKDNEQQDAGLCYPYCREGFKGAGPICWSECGSDFVNNGGTDTGVGCLKGNFSRGVGGPIHACASGYTKEGALCYENCPAGYTGVGPVCWQNCPDGYKDDGATCRRDADIISSDNSDCPWYDKCGLVTAKGCSKCPPGYTNDGCTCRRNVNIFGKRTLTRKTKVLQCAADEDYDAGLCYKKCRTGYVGVGPICWQSCPANTDDSGVSCTKHSYSRGVGTVLS